jgi:hypothetical protein
MAITERYLDVELTTGANDGTSEADAWQTWAAAAGGLAAGERLNVKNPSTRFDVSSSVFFLQGGIGTTPVHIRGYGSTIGDGVLAQMSNAYLIFNGANLLVEGLDVENGSSPASPIISVNGFNSHLYNCIARKTGISSGTVGSLLAFNGGSIANCYVEIDVDMTTTSGLSPIEVQNGNAYGNIVRFKSRVGAVGALAGIKCEAGNEHASAVIRNLVYTDRGVLPSASISGILLNNLNSNFSGNFHVCNNTIDNMYLGVFLTDQGASTVNSSSAYCNNLITSTPIGFIGTSDNNYFRPTNFLINNAVDGVMAGGVEIDTLRLTADPYVDAENQDFTLNDVPGGGAAVRARALAAVGTLDIGALGI